MTLDPRRRPRVMGILNHTPDSFSDGGIHAGADAAVRHGLAMVGEGADLIDVGGESTRPGAQRVPAEEQIRRVVEPIRRLRGALEQRGRGDVPISIDTTSAEVARAALDAGADVINDVSAGREDSALLPLAAERGEPVILMHMLGAPATMQQKPTYRDVVGEVEAFLLQRAAAAEAAGVAREQIVLDPGIGFGKTVEHNLKLLAALPRLVAHGYPVLLGASRKRFMATVTGDPHGAPENRLSGTLATTAWATAAGVHLLRVHDVAPNRQAADMAAAIARHG